MSGPPVTLVVFGASGDLMRRKLAPALYHLSAKGRLERCARIVGVARRPWDDAAFRGEIEQALRDAGTRLEREARARFVGRLHYVPLDVAAAADYSALRERLEELETGPAHRLFYLAVAPEYFGAIVAGLGRAGLAQERDGGWRHIVVEKPFGRDLASARELNGAVEAVFAERQIYRIDHYLGKETAQNLLFLRFANAIFEPLWNRNYVDHVQISVTEEVDVGRRGAYYDTAGVLRDMFQNHLLQLFALTAIEPPVPFDATTLRDEKVKVLKATRPIALEQTVFGQYEGYAGSPDVASGSTTPTYAALQLEVDNWRWQGVPFYLRSGKALARRSSQINIVFKQPPHRMFGAFQSPTPNVLSICIQPDEGVHLKFDAKVPDTAREIRPVHLEFHYRTTFPCGDLPDAYERLLIDAIHGDQSLFARSDEIEAAWRLVDPVVAHGEGQGALPRYSRGSWGPDEADGLLERSGRQWLMGCDHD